MTSQHTIAGIALLIFVVWVAWEYVSAERESRRRFGDDLDQTEHGRVEL